MPLFQLFRKRKNQKPEVRRPESQEPERVVLRDEKSGQDVRSLVARYRDGDLVFEGQDLGPSVEAFFSEWEYEWVWTVRKADLPKLQQALGGAASVLLSLQSQFSGRNAAGIESFLKSHKIPYEVWSQIGS